MKSIILLLVTLFICYVHSFGQTKIDSTRIFGFGAQIGTRNYSGLGFLALYRIKNIEANINFGVCPSCGGSKTAIGFNYFFSQKRLFNPFLSLHYAYSFGGKLDDDSDSENYRISNNNYIISALGISLMTSKDYAFEQHLSIGYSQILNSYYIEPYASNTSNDFYKGIHRAVVSGFMFNYSILLRIHVGKKIK